MSERTTVRLPEGLMAALRKKAATEGRTVTSLIEDGARLVVAEKKQPKPRIPVRISEATGGPLPGVDITNSAALQEMEDLEYIERLKHGFK